MNITEILDQVRAEFPACSTVAYADISTSMILSSSANTPLRQERLNDLCNTAVEMLSGASALQVTEVWAEKAGEDALVYQAIIVDREEMGIFLRSTLSPTDALCCVCSPDIDIDAFVSSARHHLDEIGQDK